MKYLLQFAFVFFIMANSSAQNLKTYDGKYAQGFNPNGVAKYTPKTLKYVKHGDFKISLEISSDVSNNRKKRQCY